MKKLTKGGRKGKEGRKEGRKEELIDRCFSFVAFSFALQQRGGAVCVCVCVCVFVSMPPPLADFSQELQRLLLLKLLFLPFTSAFTSALFV
jgi:hypothetical protein